MKVSIHRRRRLALALLAGAIVVYAARNVWLDWIGRSLVCAPGASSGQVIVLDNFDNEVGVFVRGAEVQQRVGSTRVLLPVTFSEEPLAEAAATEMAHALARVTGLSNWQIITVRAMEPISLNTAYAVRDVLIRENIRSVTLVSPGFRSRRSDLIYRSVLEERGMTVACLPTFRTNPPEKWASRWHGIQDVALQFMKLQYYRFWVLPRREN